MAAVSGISPAAVLPSSSCGKTNKHYKLKSERMKWKKSWGGENEHAFKATVLGRD